MSGKENNSSDEDTKEALFGLYDLAKTLMGKNGCPWDKAQTPLTMRQYLVEETFEAVDAIGEENPQHAKEELGDVLYNALFISYLYELAGDFTVSDMAQSMRQKMVGRHPHVFGSTDEKIKTEADVNRKWDEIKHCKEGRTKKSVLDEVPASFPPLLKAFKYVKKAASKGFDWPTTEDALLKVKEETLEVEEALADEKKSEHLEEELGDLLLAVVNVCRKCRVSPDVALEGALKKFYLRYTHVEQGQPKNLDDMIKLWKEAKTEQTRKSIFM